MYPICGQASAQPLRKRRTPTQIAQHGHWDWECQEPKGEPELECNSPGLKSVQLGSTWSTEPPLWMFVANGVAGPCSNWLPRLISQPTMAGTPSHREMGLAVGAWLYLLVRLMPAINHNWRGVLAIKRKKSLHRSFRRKDKLSTSTKCTKTMTSNVKLLSRWIKWSTSNSD